MPRCNHCIGDFPTVRDQDSGYICCVGCGRVLDQEIFYAGVTFEKASDGQSRLAGNILKSVQSEYSASHERTLMKGRDEIRDIVANLRVGGGDSITNRAHAFYQIAVERNFTRGRRTSQVAAACLYVACRQTKKAYLLIDFSDYLQINVYVLGAVFLQLCKLLRLEEHPIVQKLVDPSLFIHRFTERLLGRKNHAVSETALRIIGSMKRDWMQTGRKPSGLCGAALYISALSHGLKYSKSNIGCTFKRLCKQVWRCANYCHHDHYCNINLLGDCSFCHYTMVTVVHICEATLTKRLIEFENTESGSLTIDEFLSRATELDGESHSSQFPRPAKSVGTMEMLCKHKDTGEPHFALGLCRKCYNKFTKISGGLQGGAEPPAFQRAERQRLDQEAIEAKTKGSDDDILPCDQEHDYGHDEKEAQFSSKVNPDESGCESFTSKERVNPGHQAVDESVGNESQDFGNAADNDPESLSDIDDVEVDGYLHNEEEKRYKTIIWEEMNKEYLEEQAVKEAAAAAAKEAYAAKFANSSEDLLSAQELAAAAAAAVAKSRKERKERRAEEARNSTPAQTAAEATRQMLKRKTFSSRINYKALEALYTSDHENGKKQRIESNAGEADGQQNKGEENDKTLDSEVQDDGDDADILGDGDYAEVEYENYHGNGDDEYAYAEDFDFY